LTLFAIQTTDPAGQDDFLFWGKIGWIAAVVLIGLAIWFFKVRRSRRSPH